MKNLTKLASVAAIAMTCLAAVPAHAVNITFGGQSTNVSGGDQSGLTSTFVPVSNVVNPSTGYYIETFDVKTQNPFLPSGITSSVSGITIIGAGASFNSYYSVNVSTTGGGFAIQNGSTSGVAAMPAGDLTNFGFGPSPGGSMPATVKIDYTPLLTGGAKISYLGLFYGSIDTYNEIAFYSGNQLLKIGTGLLSDGIISGTEILASQGGTSGNQIASGSNVYVNLAFDPNEAFTAFEFKTTGVAFEVDNVVVGLTTRNVPEPASLALLGLGLVGIGAMRRRKNR